MKRLFDVVVASIVILSISPLILIIAITVRFALGKPILFLQKRPGRWGAPFTVIRISYHAQRLR